MGELKFTYEKKKGTFLDRNELLQLQSVTFLLEKVVVLVSSSCLHIQIPSLASAHNC